MQVPSDANGKPQSLLSQGFERSTSWINVVAALTAFASDVLKPLLHFFTLGALVAAALCGGIVWLLVRFRLLKRETGAAVFTFFVVTSVLSTAVYAAQIASGDPEEGVAAHTFPEIRRLQSSLDIVDQRTIRIEGDTKKIIGLLQGKQPPHTTAIAQHIAGDWGRGDCSVFRYRMAKTGQALVIDSVNQPDGKTPYHFEGTIVGEGDTAMEVRGETPETAKGLSATFQYETNGKTESLHWQDHVPGGTDVELNRCG